MYIGRSQRIAAIILGLIFNLLTEEEDIQRCSEKQLMQPICATITHALTLVFCRLEKGFYTFICT